MGIYLYQRGNQTGGNNEGEGDGSKKVIQGEENSIIRNQSSN